MSRVSRATASKSHNPLQKIFLDLQINDYFTKIEHFKHEFLSQK